jgi:hypothetical protein
MGSASTGAPGGGNRTQLEIQTTADLDGFLDIGLFPIVGLTGTATVAVDIDADGSEEFVCTTGGCQSLIVPRTLVAGMPLRIATRSETTTIGSFQVLVRFRPTTCTAAVFGALAPIPNPIPNSIFGPAGCGSIQLDTQSTFQGVRFVLPTIPTGTLGALVFGFTPPGPARITLPGQPGCFLLVDPSVVVPTAPGSDGLQSLQLFVPRGSFFGVQSLSLDPATSTLLTGLGRTVTCQ